MTKILVKIGAVDLTPYIKSYRVTYNTLLKGDARNAAGNLTINILNYKSKLEVGFIPMDETQMVELLSALDTFVLSIEHWDTKTQSQLTKTFFSSSPTSDFYTNRNEEALFEGINITFTEL